jgi:hypothetical protein
MKILVNCTGFLGDILFASSVAKKLKEKYGECHITYQIPLPQPKLLLEQNPYIDHVSTYDEPKPLGMIAYDLIVNIPTVDQTYPATIQMQAAAGIADQSLEFDVWTVPEYDTAALDHYNFYHRHDKIICYQADWSWRAYACTSETLESGIGAPHRNTDRILDELIKQYPGMYCVGYSRDCPSNDPRAQNPEKFARVASMIKMADWFIGAEGGLSNLAAAVGTKCIITTDFIAQNYGPNGRVKKIANPQMGPAVYYPQGGHVHLGACLTDDEILVHLKEIIG